MNVVGLDFTVKKSNRKTLSILIERDGSLSALVPEDIDDEKIAQAIASKEYLVHKKLAIWKELNENQVSREYVNGQSFLYLGRNYRLRIVTDSLAKKIILKNGYFVLPKTIQHKAKDLFIDFYKEKLTDRLVPMVADYKKRLDVHPQEIKVMELQNRWASCTDKGKLIFHWKCAMAPLEVLSYIVVHELVHLLHSNHTAAFWNEIDKVLPNYDKQIQWLKVNGASMDL